MAREFAQAEEIAFLLGDTSVNAGAGDPRNVFDGLLKQAAATPYTYNSSLDSSDGQTIVSNLFRAMRYLGIYGRNKRDLVIMVGLSAEEALLRNKSFQTISAYSWGSNAGLFTGEIGRLGGAPVVASSFLDAQPGDTYAKCLIMNSSAFVIGDWANFSIQVFSEILSQSDQVAIRARERVALAVRYGEGIINVQGFPANP